jgi:hypothetical protein
MRRAAKLPPDWFYCINCAKPKKISARRKPGTQRFCSDNCRKEYHKYGGVSVHRLRDDCQKWAKEVISPLQVAVNQLMDRVRTLESR